MDNPFDFDDLSPWREPWFRAIVILLAILVIGLILLSADGARSAPSTVDAPAVCPDGRSSLGAILRQWKGLAASGEAGRVWVRVSQADDATTVVYGLAQGAPLAFGYTFNRGCLVYMMMSPDADGLSRELTGLSRKELFRSVPAVSGNSKGEDR